jgi:glycosyltransferase involved in cell wall biosynthesis
MSQLAADRCLPSYELQGESIICFAGEDWWYHHPHSKNHILKRLARSNKVLFVNSITLGSPSISSPDFFLKVRRKLKSYLRWLRKAPEGLHVMTPLVLPFYGTATARKLNEYLLRAQIRLVMRIVGMGKPIVWVAIPTAADVAEKLDARLLVYQVTDKYEANEDSALSREVIRTLDQRLSSKAALVMYSGRKLFEESTVTSRYFLEQAVDYDHFACPTATIPPDAACIPHPVLAYFGAMDHVMDLALIQEVVRRRPEWHWMLIGLQSNLVRIDSPNVHFLGSKPYCDLPGYIQHADLFVLPWKQDNAFTSYGSAIKVKEYLATGKPVVISPLYEYLKTPGLRIYRTANEFIAHVEDSFLHDTPKDRRLRQSQVEDCTWDVRASELSCLLARFIHTPFESTTATRWPSGNKESR